MMNSIYSQKIAKELRIAEKQVNITAQLLEEGGTIPFIARYRKEMTGDLDELQIAQVRDRLAQLAELDKRREAILKSMNETSSLTDDLERQILAAENMTVLEDIYLPFKPKRKTRALMAREKGLAELAEEIMSEKNTYLDNYARKFVDAEKGVDSIEQALAGARDIIAEKIAEHADTRAAVRQLILKKGSLHSRLIKGKEETGQKYKDYFDCTELLSAVPSHRLLAMRRGEKEIVLTLEIEVPESEILQLIHSSFIKKNNESSNQIAIAGDDAYKRLLKPAMDTEVRLITKKKADTEAIRVFAENARQLLLAAPVGQKRIMAIDPGFRTGCKLVCLDSQGQLLDNTAIYPHNGVNASNEAAKTIEFLAKKYQIEAIAIGNGTAGRETESFVKSLQLANILIVMVNESGASIYSASEAAREEFPDKDITVKGAVSIGRRLMDPLAELVKIDPQSIGVGQYQHDVDQSLLKSSLDDTVVSCVNAIGVELNTASKQLLSYVSGLGPQLARNIVDHRNLNGPFRSRKELLKIPRLGAKVFEQAAAFLRIRNADHPLDASAVHPERYSLVEKMASDLKCSIDDLIKKEALRKQIDLRKYVSDGVGLPTLNDIIRELARPGMDPREKFETFSFTEGVNSIQDLKIGMTLPGIVTNITAFGAFVDIGVHQDGLVHLSQLADRYVKDPNEVVKVNQPVSVRVTEVDLARKRIALSMKAEAKMEKSTKRESSTPTNKSKKSEAESDIATKLAALKSKFS